MEYAKHELSNNIDGILSKRRPSLLLGFWEVGPAASSAILIATYITRNENEVGVSSGISLFAAPS